MRCAGTVLRFAELRDRARKLARRLVREGVRPEMTVGILLERSTDLLVAVLGVLGSGARLPAPRSRMTRRERLAYTSRDAVVCLVVTDGRFAPLLAGDPRRAAEASPAGRRSSPARSADGGAHRSACRGRFRPTWRA